MCSYRYKDSKAGMAYVNYVGVYSKENKEKKNYEWCIHYIITA